MININNNSKLNSKLFKLRKFLAGDIFSIILFILSALIILFNIELPGSIYMGFLVCAILVVSDDIVSCLLPALLLISFAIRNKNSFEAYMEYLWGIPIVVFAVLFHIIAYRKSFDFRKGKLLLPMCITSVAVILGGVGIMTFEEYTTKINLSYIFSLGILIVLVYIFIGGVIGPGKNYTEHMDERFSKIMIVVTCYLVFSIIAYYIENIDKFILDPGVLPFQWRNNACTIMMLGMPFAFYMAAKKNFLYIIVPFAAFGAMVLSGSRGGLLFGAIELLMLIVYFAIKDIKHRKMLLAIVAVGVVAVAIMTPKLIHLIEYTLDRFTSYKENFRRLGLIQRSFEDFLANPLTGRGVGYMGNRDLHPSKEGLLCWYHSSLPQVWGSFGIVGILAYGYQFYERVRFFMNDKSLFVKTVFLSFIGLEMMSLVNPGIFAPAYLVILTIMICIAENYSYEDITI